MSAIGHTYKELSTHQVSLEKVLHQLLPGENILENARKDTLIKNPVTGKFLEVDIYIPNLALCFEFQDSYHYTTTWYSHLPLSTVKNNDNAKKDLLLQRKETMVFVPCWWDGACESLAASIRFARPDLVFDVPEVDPITTNPPRKYFEDRGIPDIGELMLASFPTSLDMGNSISIYNPWWVGEKYDGIRFCWNSRLQTLYTRTGGELTLPDYLMVEFDRCTSYLDGEIWFGKGNFTESIKILHSLYDKVYWPLMRGIVFDDPAPLTENYKFEKRYSQMLAAVPRDHLFLVPASRLMCNQRKALRKLIQHVILDGGEGVILRKPRSIYLHGRSASLLKLKSSRGDNEALVVHAAADNSYYKLQLPEGTIFNVRRENFKYGVFPKRGDVVSFLYDNYSKKSIPVNPRIYRIRPDLSWEEVLDRFAKSPAHARPLNKSSRIDLSAVPVQLGAPYMQRRMRDLLERFATLINIDPLLPESWYNITRGALEQSIMGAKSLLANYKGGLVRALLDVLPNIGLDERKLLQRHYWEDPVVGRSFLEHFARLKGFDPEISENWYNISDYEIKTVKNGPRILQVYGSLDNALVQLYPKVIWDRASFSYLPNSHWDSIENRKEFFITMAKHMQFDPLVAENWYSISLSTVKLFKNAESFLANYRGSFVRALLDLFPDIQFDRGKFEFIPENFWKSRDNRRKFFVRFARQRNFDPFKPNNWYSVPPAAVKALPQAKFVLAYYDGSTSKALLDLFAEIGLDASKLSGSKNYWKDESVGRKYFNKIARELGIDPLSPTKGWSSVNPSVIHKYKHVKSILQNYDNNLVVALRKFYPSVNLDPDKFKGSPKYWNFEENRRAFFEAFAKEKGFDPNDPKNWYQVQTSMLKSSKDSNDVLSYHGGNWVRALMDLFPNIGIDANKFPILPRKYWQDINNRRQYFVTFARARGLDPLLAHTWYKITSKTVQDIQRESTILSYYNCSFTSAVISLFPDIKFDISKFSVLPKGYWKHANNQRLFFENFAKRRKFDPLLASGWYSVPLSKLAHEKHVDAIIGYYNGNVVTALTQLFPNVSFDAKLFT